MQLKDFKLDAETERLYHTAQGNIKVQRQVDNIYKLLLGTNRVIKMRILDDFSIISIVKITQKKVDPKTLQSEVQPKYTYGEQVAHFLLPTSLKLLKQLDWSNQDIIVEIAQELKSINVDEPYLYQQRVALQDITNLFDNDPNKLFLRIYALKQELLNKVSQQKSFDNLSTYKKFLRNTISQWAQVNRTQINAYQFKALLQTGQVPSPELSLAARGCQAIWKQLSDTNFFEESENATPNIPPEQLKAAYNNATLSDQQYRQEVVNKNPQADGLTPWDAIQ